RVKKRPDRTSPHGAPHANAANGVTRSKLRRIDRKQSHAKEGKMEKTLRRTDPEAVLDEAIQNLTGKCVDDVSADEWRSLREQLRLEVLFPGQYVAFRDHFRGEGDSRRLMKREVLRSSRNLMTVSRHLQGVPQDQRENVFIAYIEPVKSRDHSR